MTAEVVHFIYWVPVWELLKMCAQNFHIYHRKNSAAACIIHFIYMLVLQHRFGSDVGMVFLAHTVFIQYSRPGT